MNVNNKYNYNYIKIYFKINNIKMNPRSSSEFQNGIIDLFKENKVFELNIVDCQKKGNVIAELVRISN